MRFFQLLLVLVFLCLYNGSVRANRRVPRAIIGNFFERIKQNHEPSTTEAATPENVTENESNKTEENNGKHPAMNLVTAKPEKGRWNVPVKSIKFLADQSQKVVDFGKKLAEKPTDIIKRGVQIPINIANRSIEAFGEAFGIKNRISRGLDSNVTFFKGGLDQFKLKLHSIFPGTKWCGGGDIAEDDSDLGLFKETDKCCRAHDKCPDNIEAGETKHGLENTGLFTRSHCDCDEEFYKCLKEARSPIAFDLGVTYFTMLGPQCFREDYPLTECLEWVQTKSGQYRCDGYGQDKSAKPTFQWFDNKIYL